MTDNLERHTVFNTRHNVNETAYGLTVGSTVEELGSLEDLVVPVPQAFTLKRAPIAGSTFLFLFETANRPTGFDTLPVFLWAGLPATSAAAVPTTTVGAASLSVERIWQNTDPNDFAHASIYVWRITETTGWISIAGGSGQADDVTIFETL